MALQNHCSGRFAQLPFENLARRVAAATDTGAEVEARIAEYVPAGADDVVIVPSATDDDPAGGRTLKLATEIANRLQ